MRLATTLESLALDRREISRYYSPKPDSVKWWFHFGQGLDPVAENADKIVTELQSFASELAQSASRPAEAAARSAARKLDEVGISPADSATIMRRLGIVRSDYSAANVVDLLRKSPPGGSEESSRI